MLGIWKIKVQMLSYEKEIEIEIKKYVLPKFQMTITPPPFVSYLSKAVKTEFVQSKLFDRSLMLLFLLLHIITIITFAVAIIIVIIICNHIAK